MTDIVGYQPGEAWLVSGATSMVLTSGDATAARHYWARVRRAAPAEEIFDGTEPGSAAGDLALVVWAGSTVRVLVRGAAAVRVTGPAGNVRTITAEGLLTWREELLDGPVGVEVGLPADALPPRIPDEADLLPVPAGVVRAGYAHRKLPHPARDESPAAAPAPGAAVPVDPPPVSAPVPEVSVPDVPVPDAPVPDAPVLDAPVPDRAFSGAEPGSQVVDPLVDPLVPGIAERGDARPVREASSSVEAAPADEPGEITGDDAVTVISMVPTSGGRPASVAAKRAGAPGAASPVAPDGGDADADAAGDPADMAATGGPVELASTGDPVGALDSGESEVRRRTPDVTQAVPLDYDEDAGHLPGAPGQQHAQGDQHAVPGQPDGAAADHPGDDPRPTVAPEPTTIAPEFLPGPPPSPSAGGPVLGDHDGITELAENLPAGFTPPPLPPPLAPGWVYASVCPQGHANQPHAGNCRVCGQPLPPGDPVVAPQPLLGRLRFSTGELVDLDRRVIIGRAPSVSRVSSSELPRLVTVPSPQQDISRSHVEVRLEDWHLVVADLHSTNGTVLRAPDRPEQLLHPGQEMVVEPGWTVDLGDGVTVAVEAAG